MAEQLNISWLVRLSNPNHDGTTQQIDDCVTAFECNNVRFNEKRQALHLARQAEDEVWIKSQRDPAVKLLEGADKGQDSYVSAARYITMAHAGLPDTEPTKAEAVECEQVFKDANFRTDNPYGAEADKIIQMHQNLLPHQAFLTQIGAWSFYTKAVEQAQLVRQYLSARALTLGEAVKGEMKTARRATDLAVADLYKVIEAMMELMPSAEMTTLYNQLKGIEIYARQYYLKEGSTGSGAGQASPDPSQGGENGGQQTGGDNNQGGGTGTIDTGGGASPSPSQGGENGGDTTGGDNGGSTGGGDNGGGTGSIVIDNPENDGGD